MRKTNIDHITSVCPDCGLNYIDKGVGDKPCPVCSVVSDLGTWDWGYGQQGMDGPGQIPNKVKRLIY